MKDLTDTNKKEKNIKMEDTKKLGFGFMRLPQGNKENTYDMDQVKKMVDAFMEAGMTYFDTAYVYDDGRSEAALKEALVDRYPRESYTVATKLFVSASDCKDEASAKKQLETSLSRLGTGYIDYYLLHSVQTNNYKKYDEYHLWDFVKEKKKEGVIRHMGFSFHDSPEMLDDLLTKHPEVDFVQLQLNYADWEDANVRSRANYETARRHGKPIVVMEPVKGGLLANPPEKIKDLFKEACPEASPASWAIRYIASKEGILTVLSGMSTLEQVKDNVSYMRDFKPLSSKEEETIKKAQDILSSIDSIPCTGCHYCTGGCPRGINIPKVLGACNRELIFEDRKGALWEYDLATKRDALASECIQCGQCEEKCPQHLPIIKYLKEAARKYEG